MNFRNSKEIFTALQANQISIEDAKRELTRLSKVQTNRGTDSSEPVAIIGMSGRYPDADNLHQYWDNLVHSKNSIKKIPHSRWDMSTYYDPRPNQKGKIYCDAMGVLDGIEYFDPLFFMISPAEAEVTDPQHRLFLQEGYKAFEDAGYSPKLLNEKKCGVYLGIMNHEYAVMLSRSQVREAVVTGNSYAIASARIAYYLNLKGPAISLDTACSSSLVAAHLACQALSNREIDLALIGGVTLYLTPESYIGMCGAGMLSPDGQCKTFDNSANGFVPGEGVGALVLKRLTDAQSDHDFIYGVIIGSGINHDGKTNGITAPSVASQIQLEREIYTKFQIAPESIGYAEMHGTGTKLGDPIELEALATAFKEKTDNKQFCAIGSVKSNIGHVSAAAGVAGIQKVLLCLKHKTLVPTLNFNTPNEHFDFQNSPFYVNTEVKHWKTAQGKHRHACISSFGFSGTNAHIVIEEWQGNRETVRKQTTRCASAFLPLCPSSLIVLSAKNEERLKVYAKNMVDFIKTNTIDLTDMAFTLQVGRGAMEERLAVVAESMKELEDRLIGYVEGRQVENLYQGRAVRQGSGIDPQVQYKNDAELAGLWVRGADVDWNRLYGDTKPYRISLPTYPFAKEHCWITTESVDNSAFSFQPSAFALQNTSDLSGLRFSSVFAGDEFFLSDHVVNGQRILLGVVYLEMARAAAAAAANVPENGIRLDDVVWVSPLAAGETPIQVHVRLFPKENRKIAFEICSLVSEQLVMHCRGTACYAEDGQQRTEDRKIILPSAARFTREQCYDAFRGMGIDYGPGLQGIESLYAESDRVLAKLVIPASVADTQNQFVLHPSLMDAALQAIIGLTTDTSLTSTTSPPLPFALESLEVFGKCTPTLWALVQYADRGRKGDIQKFDIDLCNEHGTVCVRMKGFSVRAVNQNRVLILQPCWKERITDSFDFKPDLHLVMLCETGARKQDYEAYLKTRIKGIRCLTLRSENNGIVRRFNAYAVQVFEEIRRIIETKQNRSVLIQFVTLTEQDSRLFSGMSGLLKTARMENPNIIGQMIALDSAGDVKRIAEVLEENLRRPADAEIFYQKGKRFTRDWTEVEASSENPSVPWKSGDIWLITGGIGGLGLIFAKEIAAQAKGATLVLTGRSPLTPEKKAQIEQAGRLNDATIQYRQADVTRKQAVDTLIQNITDDFGNLNGIIHAAGVIKDNFILKKTKDEFAEVMAPKVSGLIHLDEASKDIPLDWFILFSSAAGALGNIGQADYACANAFMDAYAEYRNELVSAKQRHGRTLSINWHLWKEGGMSIDKETETRMMQTAGMIPMQTATGIRALYRAMALNHARVMVMEGDPVRMKQTLFSAPMPKRRTESLASSGFLSEKIENYLKTLLFSVINVPVHFIDADDPMETYGIDSIMVLRLMDPLEQTFGTLSKTLFFEYRTIRELAEYFLKYHSDKLSQLTVNTGTEGQRSIGTEEHKSSVIENQRIRVTEEPTLCASDPLSLCPSPGIAIIGVSGRYPMADSLEEFWQNLKQGKDCITEIPKDRWDWRKYPDRTGAYFKWGGFIRDADKFDPVFFNMAPSEAELTDPQERLFLETVWHTLEDTGYTRSGLWGTRTGVFVGVMNGDYQLFGHEAIRKKGAGIPASSYASIANRVSYWFNFNGPSIALDTMCSSSLTAIHLACESIRRGECEIAIAGGVNLLIHPQKYLFLSQGKFMSEDGKCRSFGVGGTGYVPGEGVGAVLLKPLQQAVADKDFIYAVIRGTSVNHGGKTNSYTVPNPNAQAQLITEALSKAGVHPQNLSYIEAHGTGTALGDPIEITGLTKAFGEHAQKRQYCAIGSVKSNIGHLEAAAGMAGLTKVLLQIKHRQIVPSLHSQTLNPYIKFEDTPFFVQQTLGEWKQPSDNGSPYPRLAAISSFGAGGSNAHIIVQEYENNTEVQDYIPQSPQIFTLSARNERQLRIYAQKIKDFADNNPDIILTELTHTLQTAREHLEQRMASVVSSMDDLREKLKNWCEEQDIAELYTGNVKQADSVRELISGSSGKQFVESVIKNREWNKLARLWVSGADIDWKQLYPGAMPRRHHIPNYPFARERYWVSVTSDQLPVVGEQLSEETEKSSPISGNGSLTTEITGITDYLTTLIRTTIKLDSEKMNPEENFEYYGLDSVIIAQLTGKLEQRFGKLPSTLFFTYKNIRSLAQYLNQLPVTSYQLSEEPADKPSLITDNRSPITDIAIIGLSGRYPMAETTEIYWDNLKAGRDCITEIPAGRWDFRSYPEAYCKWGGFLDDIDKFDASFFNISPNVARLMDPQERLFLQTVWSCLEDAGYTRKQLEDPDAGDRRGNVGVFAGVSFNEYPFYAIQEWQKGNRVPLNSQICSVANRVSYFFNFRGPSLSIDTACSSSLYALHLACESIRNRECEMAVAGGVNLSVHPAKYVSLCIARFASSDGRCRAFGAGGDGYVPGEGVGAVLLKPLHKALIDRDDIYAVIKGTSVNHDGRTHGYSVPNPVAQAEVIRAAIKKSGVDSSTVSYVEAHGTGTSLGDPIEIAGLTEGYGNHNIRKQYCPIGSVKSNIGHLEAAAGISQLTKVILQMKHRQLAPSLLHSEHLNPNIDFEQTPFFVNRTLSEWEPPVIDGKRCPRRAGISSFGYSGVNVHAVIEEYQPEVKESRSQQERPHLIPLSANAQESLRHYAGKLKMFLEKRLNTSNMPALEDIAYTLQVGREAMKYRAAFVVNSHSELIEKLECVENVKEVREDEKTHSLNHLASQWVYGTDIDWDSLHTGSGIENGYPRRISLPAYAFLKESYWISSQLSVNSYQLSEKSDDKPSLITDNSSLIAELHEAPEQEQLAILVRFLQTEAGNVLGCSVANLPDPAQGFFEIGMESLQLAQFRSKVENAFGIKIQDTAAFDYPTIREFAGYLLTEILSHPSSVTLHSVDDELLKHLIDEPIPAYIQNMSIHEVERLLESATC